jgi:hypothetical protein
VKKSKRDDLKDSGFLVVNARGRRKRRGKRKKVLIRKTIKVLNFMCKDIFRPRRSLQNQF